MTSVQMNSSTYEAVSTETKEMIDNEQEVVVTKRKYLLGGGFACFMFGALFMLMLSNGSSGPELRSTHKTSSKAFLDGTCAPCSFAQCKSNLCDASLVPYVCTSGAAINGCSADEDAWLDSGVCDECCSLADCEETESDGDSEDSGVEACSECTAEQCATLSEVSEQKCGGTAPFVCVEGSARMGCSEDPYHWSAMPDTQCSDCCNQLSC